MTNDESLAARAAWLSYIGGYTQGEIARRLDVSSAKAHRLIGQAHKAGLVRVFIEGAPGECLRFEEEIARRFSLQSCVVAPDIDDDDARGSRFRFAGVGAAAAKRLYAVLEGGNGLTIGLGKGRSLAAMVQNFPRIERPDLKFVSVSGSLTRNLSANPYDIVHNMVERTGGEGYFLPVPYIAASTRERELLIAQKSVADVMELARRADVYVIGVGAVGRDPAIKAHIQQVGMVSDDEWRDLQDKNAVGDIMGCFIDADGLRVDSAINRMTLGLHLEDLKGRRVIAVVGGKDKGQAVLAALRTGAVTDLIIDEGTAASILKIADGEGA
ncbi:sugar-binding transcriptional regulator [Varunaivibrio sulfuroxidans]|uniref:DNA-binding transcriptional regulator LsrR (DeoR family) n=1 Tax=Varunaivibrio sulfuroxidans TaxID=1773489 RepID=A0A4R3JDY0_9PROT|nr:sugar-binding transcriptional regulator [Varunaivibrio sulfuroxidans]TCS63974.1 DNA-binding transcriptional regulator LsrR (DeoR family) [Varunaivibrio sulfuroxidans]WES31573.1 sugar-binding transcriptional regulator [Varunaivibrio sulfuroxidans]